jgi:mannosyltransferase
MSPSAATASPIPRALLAVAILIVAIAAALRFWQAGESLWLDELHTAWCATGKLSEVAPRAAIGNQSPLFFWLEWLLAQLLGESELALRLPSLIAGSLLPLALFLIAWRWTQSSRIGLTAAALAAIDHNAIFYATEARPYALVQLLAVLHIAITAEVIERPSRWLRTSWIGLAVLLFHMHYTAALLIPAELAFLLAMKVHSPGTAKYQPAMLLTDLVIAGALCLPALGNLRAIFARRENWAAFVHPEPLWQLAVWFPWSLSAPFVLVASMTRSQHRRATSLALIWLLVPALFAWLATTTDLARLFFPRYLVAIAPAAILLAACCADFAPWQWSKGVIVTLLVASGLYASGVVQQVQHDGRVIGDRHEDWRAAVAWLNEQLPRQPYPVLVASGLIEADALHEPHDSRLDDYCLFPVTGLYKLAADRSALVPLPFHEPHRLDNQVRQLVGHRRGAWLVMRGSPRNAERMAAAIQESGVRSQEAGRTKELKSFGNVQVILLLTSDL